MYEQFKRILVREAGGSQIPICSTRVLHEQFENVMNACFCLILMQGRSYSYVHYGSESSSVRDAKTTHTSIYITRAIHK